MDELNVEVCAATVWAFSSCEVLKDAWMLRDSNEGCANVGTWKGSFQHTPGAAGTILRPIVATFLGHSLGATPAKHFCV